MFEANQKWKSIINKKVVVGGLMILGVGLLLQMVNLFAIRPLTAGPAATSGASENYKITADLFSSGGELGSSTNYGLFDTFGEPFECGQSNSSNFGLMTCSLPPTDSGELPDTTPPQSAVNELPATYVGLSIEVSWSGSDDASGINCYTIEYRDGLMGDWTEWFNCTTNTSDIFTGEDQHTYYFRSKAQDNADNWESFPTSPDYDTAVQLKKPTLYLFLPAILNNYCRYCEIEPNDVEDNATGPLNSGLFYIGDPDGNGSAADNDYYYFDLETAGTITVNVTNFLAKGQVHLFGPGIDPGNPIRVDDQKDGHYQFSHDVTAVGKYYIRVISLDGHETGNGNYFLQVTYPVK